MDFEKRGGRGGREGFVYLCLSTIICDGGQGGAPPWDAVCLAPCSPLARLVLTFVTLTASSLP